MKKHILIVEDEFIVANDLSHILKASGFEVCGIADSYDQALKQINLKKPYLAILDIRLKGKLTGIDLAKKLQELNIPFIYLSANSNKTTLEEAKATKPYGFLVKPFREKDVIIALEIASYHHEHSNSISAAMEQTLIKVLSTLANSEKIVNNLCQEFTKVFQPHISFDLLSLTRTHNQSPEAIGCYRIGFNEYQFIGIDELSLISAVNTKKLKEQLSEAPIETSPKIYGKHDLVLSLKENPFKQTLVDTFHLNSQMVIPIPFDSQTYNLSFFSKQQDIFNSHDIEILYKLTPYIHQILSKKFKSHKAIEALKTPKITVPKNILENPIKAFEGMIGKSPQLLTIFDLVKKVAPMDTSILIMGESGTGKELVARSIHNLSARREQPFVTLNCGAMPENLIESILFGHEKGAFTGATERRIGKFEQAEGGTIFLDEIGEMPTNLQVKLLRALQEKEIEKIGSSTPIKLNVRVISATNKDLEQEVEEGNFRLDLFYRLNVFPISVPPLRERKEDIPLLAKHFITKICQQNRLENLKIEDVVLSGLMDYHWPGNIRELENYIEKSILLANGPTIKELYLPFNLNQVKNKSTSNLNEKVQTIHEVERDYILYILRKCNGKVFGKDGAAELLQIPPSTLNSKIRKLGIQKEEIYS